MNGCECDWQPLINAAAGLLVAIAGGLWTRERTRRKYAESLRPPPRE